MILLSHCAATLPPVFVATSLHPTPIPAPHYPCTALLGGGCLRPVTMGIQPCSHLQPLESMLCHRNVCSTSIAWRSGLGPKLFTNKLLALAAGNPKLYLVCQITVPTKQRLHRSKDNYRLEIRSQCSLWMNISLGVAPKTLVNNHNNRQSP